MKLQQKSIRCSNSQTNRLYTYIMLKPNSDTLRTGDAAPDFALPTADRNIVQLSDYRGKPLVIAFIRGTW